MGIDRSKAEATGKLMQHLLHDIAVLDLEPLVTKQYFRNICELH